MVSAQPMTLWTVNFREKHVLVLLLLVFPFFHRNCNYHLSVYFLKGFEITITMLTFIRVVNRYTLTRVRLVVDTLFLHFGKYLRENEKFLAPFLPVHMVSRRSFLLRKGENLMTLSL